MTSGDTLEKWFADVETSWTILSASLGIAFLVGYNLYFAIFSPLSAYSTWSSSDTAPVSSFGFQLSCY